MQIERYPWHSDIWQQWQHLLRQERLHHAILLCAPKGSGKKALSALLAKTILCRHATDDPCDLCHSCQLFQAGTHPDFHWIAPEIEGKQLGVDLIRKSNQYAIETSQLGGARVIVISCADRLGEAAANALLKTLEEPPSQCHFILLTESIDAIVPTIVSRCNKWKPQLPNETLVKHWVEGQVQKHVPLQLIRLNRGAPLSAKLSVEQDHLSKHQVLLQVFFQFISEQNTPFALTEIILKDTGLYLQWLSFILLDVMKIKQGTTEGIVHCEHLEQLHIFAVQIADETLSKQFVALNQLKSKLAKHSGLNTELLLAEWLIDFMNE